MPPERIRFQPSRLWKLFLPVVLLAVVSFVVNPEAWRHAPWWVYAIFGGLPFFLMGGHFLMKRRYYLELSDAGLTIATLGKTRFLAWEEIAGVGSAEREIDTAARADVVLIRLHQASTLNKLARSFTGGNISLLAVYELPPEEITRLIRARLPNILPQRSAGKSLH